jgi:hypothetical protein
MKKLTRSLHVVLAMALFFGITLTAVNSVDAAWYWTHGNTASLQDKTVTDYWAGEAFEYGWGLDIRQKPGTFNWVHFSVPTLGDTTKGARYIRLRFWTGSVDAYVSDVHVWNGDTKVKEFKGGWSDGWKTLTLDLGSVVSFNKGMGISVKINAGVESMDHRFKLSGAGANFVNK